MENVYAIGLMCAVIVIPSLIGIRFMYTVCWLIYVLFAYMYQLEAALGLATTMGITMMIGWYTLQVLDRAAWSALLHGWLGIWAKTAIIPIFARLGDILIHIILPISLYCNYSKHIRPWMGPAALFLARVWSLATLRRIDFFAPADDVYGFVPPRSKHFWDAAYKLQVILDLTMPFLCMYIEDRALDLYKYMLLFCTAVLIAQTCRSFLLPQLRQRAKNIMFWLLEQGAVTIGVDIIVHDQSIWLDWMTSGMLAIGESYMAKQWDAGKGITLDNIIFNLLRLPAAARRQMFHSWEARIVSLLARLLLYPSSCAGSIVGPVHEQFDIGPAFYRDYLDPTLYTSFGIWKENDTEQTLQDAQNSKFDLIATKLGLSKQSTAGHYVLDLSFQAYGSVACYIAKNYAIRTLCIVTSLEEQEYGQSVMTREGVDELVEFLVIEGHDEFSAYFSQDGWENTFTHIYSMGWIEQLQAEEVPACLQVLEQILLPSHKALIEFIGSTGSSIVSSQLWANMYIHRANQPTNLPSSAQFCDAARSVRFMVVRTEAYAKQADRTFVSWYNRFCQRFIADSYPSELPDSFCRTWEFYLLHSAACFRARTIQPYLVELEKS